jgi:hypothetical protein
MQLGAIWSMTYTAKLLKIDLREALFELPRAGFYAHILDDINKDMPL